MPKHKVAMLTAGGLAPCLSSAVAELIGRYTELAPEAEIIAYLDGYAGLLQGNRLPSRLQSAPEPISCMRMAARRSATAASSSPMSPTA